eukprot:5586276-Alexandrium_andersonii.AAC.1
MGPSASERGPPGAMLPGALMVGTRSSSLRIRGASEAICPSGHAEVARCAEGLVARPVFSAGLLFGVVSATKRAQI